MNAPRAGASSRFAIIDAARGAALAAMFTYHLTWDLGYFGLIDRDVPMNRGFQLYGHVIASSFLALVGASLVLAARNGLRWGPYGRRLAMVGAAAASVTAATWYGFPESYIFFGILHMIAVASIMALPFLNAPLWLTSAVAVAVFAAPFVAAAPMFDQPLWQWSGLGLDQPNSNDWRPVFPWLAFTLAGVVAMRAALAHGLPQTIANWTPGGAATRALAWSGRHSLLVYLVHQPVFLAILFVATQLTRAPVDPQEAPFRSQCETQCTGSGGDALLCARLCGCMVKELRSADLWKIVVTRALTPAEREKVDGLTRICARNAADAQPQP